jgi:pimeloyl-ACP methyl ester carboxylesterase
VNISDAELAELRRRISATRWPDRETVTDQSQGPQLATLQKLARYWVTEYDWRKVEARLNALPNFVTMIDGLDIHFIHVRSKHKNALPLIVTHGWPGSIIEELKIVDPLTNPMAHGASAADAFDLVIPSIPGYGFSGKPTMTGWDPAHIARAWVVLMKRLGYGKFVAQGGDWGAIVTDLMAAQGHPELLGIQCPACFRPTSTRLPLRALRRRPVSPPMRDSPTGQPSLVHNRPNTICSLPDLPSRLWPNLASSQVRPSK